MLVEGTSSSSAIDISSTNATSGFNDNSGMEETIVPCTSTNNNNNSNMDYLTEALKLHEDVPDTPVGPVETENVQQQQGNGKSAETHMTDVEGVKFSGIPVVKAILDTKQKVDTVLVCSDGRIGAHRLVLTAASQFMGMLFEDQKLGEIAVVLLPDITKKTMITLLHLAYTGQMIFTEDEQADVLSAMECLLFCQTGNIVCIPVKVVPPPPEPGPSRTESTGFRQGPKSKQEKRKRHEDSISSPSKNFKKQRLDENGHRVQVGYRTGTPIGKKGAKKLKIQSQKEKLKRGEGICSPPNLKSDPITKTVSLNVSKMPLCSIRIRPIEDHVCIEIHKKRKPAWLTKHRQENEKKSTTTTDKKDDKRLVEITATTTTTTLSSSPSSSSVQPKNLELKEKDSVSNKNSNNNTNKVHCLKSSDTRPLTESKKGGSVSPLSIGKNSEDTESGIMDINKPINDELIPCESTKKNAESENKKKGENSISSSSSGHGESCGSESDNH